MIDDYFRSVRMREANLERAGLRGVARSLYKTGLVRLSKAEEVASKGNQGSGYVIRESREKKR